MLLLEEALLVEAFPEFEDEDEVFPVEVLLVEVVAAVEAVAVCCGLAVSSTAFARLSGRSSMR